MIGLKLLALFYTIFWFVFYPFIYVSSIVLVLMGENKISWDNYWNALKYIYHLENKSPQKR